MHKTLCDHFDRRLSRFLPVLGLVLSPACADDTSTTPSGGGGSGGEEIGGGGDPSGGGGGTAGSPAGGGGAEPNPPVVTIVSESDDSTSEHEPQLVLGQDGRVVATWNAFNADPTNFYHLEYAVSDDLGESWGDVISIPLPSDNNIGSNATLDVAADGTIYLAYATEYVDQAGTRSAQRVWLTSLAPSGESFGEPVMITDSHDLVGVYDQPAITVTPSGALLITYGEAPPSLASLNLVTQLSDDGGATWTRTVPFPEGGPQYMNLFHPCVSKEAGRVHLLHADSDLGIVLWSSDDGGETFPQDRRTVVEAPDEENLVSLMVDGNCVTNGDEVWAIYGLSDHPNPAPGTVPRLTHVAIAHSSDGGATIDRRALVEDASLGPYFLLPRIAHEGGGVLDITYYEGTGEGDATATYRHARSEDGGVTFEPSEIVADPVTYELKRTTEQWFGDYMDVESKEGVVYGVFTDNSAPAAHIAFFSTEGR